MLFTALIAPYYVDWASYKKDFERETSRIIGQKVEVLGETWLRLLPLPSVTFGGLAVGTNHDKSPMMTVDQFTMDIELLPLLKGKLQVVKLNLVRPRVNIHVGENGAIAWTNRRGLAVNPELIKLDNFNVTNGEVKIHGLAGGRTISLEQLEGRISAKSLYGPWRVGVDGYIGSKRARIDLVTGHLQDDGSLRVKLSAKRADLPYKLSLDGPVRMHDELLRWDGDYRLSALNAVGGNGIEIGTFNKQALPIVSEGKFGATPRLVEVPEFRLEVGERDDPYTITGTAYAQIEEKINFEIIADGRQIDLDRMGPSGNKDREESGLSLEQRFGVLRSIVEKVPLPAAQGIIDLSLPAIVAGDTLIRDVSARIAPDRKGWKIKHLNAVFPGNTKFEANGKVGLGDVFGFSGHMVVASRQPTGLAAWLGKRNNEFVRKLHSAGFSADVVISDNQSSLENLELILDAALLKGKLQRIVGKDQRAAIVASLEGAHINLDDLRAIFALTSQDNADVVTNHDLDISLKAGKLAGFDITAENVEARFRVKGGTVSVEKLVASDFFGASISSSGRIDDLLKRPNGNFDLKVTAQRPGRLLQYIRSKLPENRFLTNLANSPDLAKNLDLEFAINARSFKNISVKGSKGQALVKGMLGGSKVNIDALFEGKLDDINGLKLDVVSNFENENPSDLLLQLGVPVLPVDVSGPLQINSVFGGEVQKGFRGDLSAQMLQSKFVAEGFVHIIGDKAGEANFKLTHSSKDIAPMMLLAGIVGPGFGFEEQSVPASFTGDVDLTKDKMILKDGRGQISGHEYSTELEFQQNSASNHRLNGRISAAKLDLPLLAKFAFTAVDATARLDEDGWSEANFGKAIFEGLDGEIKFEIASSNLGIGQVAKNLKGNLALVNGSLNLNEITGEWLDGEIEANLSLTNGGGIGALSAQYEISGGDAKLMAQTIGAKQFFEGRINILGDVEASGRSSAAIVSSLTGSGTIDLADVMISGINTSPLGEIFKHTDQENFEILDENVLPILSAVIDDGTVEIPTVSVPYIVALGKFRARNISLHSTDTKMVAAIEIDIKKRIQNTELSIKFDPGIEWVDGTDPIIVMGWSGNIKSPKRLIDVQPLSGFLSLRNFEREQRRVDLLQASILEKQRMRRDIIITNARVRYRQRLRNEELRRQRLALLKNEETKLRKLGLKRHNEMLAQQARLREEERRVAAELERKRLEEEARIAAEIERKRLEEEARLAAEAERKRLEEEVRLAAEAERLRLEEEARLAAEAERLRLEEEARLAAEAERLRLEEEARIAAEIERKRLEEEARLAAEAERKRLEEEVRLAAEAERLRLEEEARLAAEAERLRLEEEARLAAKAERLRLEEEARLAAEAERLRLEEEARLAAKAERLRLEEEARLAAKAERQRLEEEVRLAAKAEQKRLEEEVRLAAKIERERIAQEARKAEEERKKLVKEAEIAEAKRKQEEELVQKNAAKLRLDEASAAQIQNGATRIDKQPAKVSANKVAPKSANHANKKAPIKKSLAERLNDFLNSR